jgi:hypothetical protein
MYYGLLIEMPSRRWPRALAAKSSGDNNGLNFKTHRRTVS